MIVKLHDGTVGELVGWKRDLPRGGLTYSRSVLQIAVLREGSRDEVLAVLWESEPFVFGDNIDAARRILVESCALAGLCFWPDPNGCALDLSPWVRDRLDRANEWCGPSAGFCA